MKAGQRFLWFSQHEATVSIAIPPSSTHASPWRVTLPSPSQLFIRLPEHFVGSHVTSLMENVTLTVSFSQHNNSGHRTARSEVYGTKHPPNPSPTKNLTLHVKTSLHPNRKKLLHSLRQQQLRNSNRKRCVASFHRGKFARDVVVVMMMLHETKVYFSVDAKTKY